jgi:hypothetical protein
MGAMRVGFLVLLSLAACRPFGGSGGFVGSTSQECAWTVQGTQPEPVTILFVVDDSAAADPLQTRIASEVARIVDEQLAFDPAHGRHVWYHFGAISADPADGARLRGGCGLADGRRFVDYRRGVFSNVEPALGIGAVVGCLAAGGSAGPPVQQPLTLAARLLTTDIPANRGFHRASEEVEVIFLLAADYPDDGQPLLDALRPGPSDYIFASVAPPSSSLDAVVSATKPHVQLPPDATSWSPLFDWSKKLVFDLSASSCLWPRDPAHLDFVVEDVTTFPNGHTSIAELQPCTATMWEPSCWHLAPEPMCPDPGLRFEVQRPITGWPVNTATHVRYDCAVTPIAR